LSGFQPGVWPCLLISADTGPRGNMDVQCVMAPISVETYR